MYYLKITYVKYSKRRSSYTYLVATIHLWTPAMSLTFVFILHTHILMDINYIYLDKFNV